jgi:hypothetical protein
METTPEDIESKCNNIRMKDVVNAICSCNEYTRDDVYRC